MRYSLFLISFFILICPFSQAQSGKSVTTSWADAQQARKSSVVFYWYESKPFIWNEAGHMTGIEYEIIEGFKQYLQTQYGIDLHVEWIEGNGFEGTYMIIRDEKREGIFAASAFSITPERKEEVGFSPPYMPDVTVLLTNKDIPIVKTVYEFDEVFPKLKAITIKGTTYEKDLLAIERQRKIDLNIQYISSDKNILNTILETDSSFGFTALPLYLNELNKNSALTVVRQNLYPIKREGYAIIYPKASDWSKPLHEYLTSEHFQSQSKKIIDRYFENNVFEFTENLFYNSDETALLTQEKEIQQRDLAGKDRQIKQETILRNFLIAAFVVILVFLTITFIQFQKRIRANKILSDQKEKIDLQRMELEKQNEKLIYLNEEKNNLIKILAHDLRTPINHVHGLAQIFLIENSTLPPEQKDTINKIIDSSLRLSAMIGKILDIDAIEGNRVNMVEETIDLPALLKKVTSSFDKLAARKKITINTSLNFEGLTITGDSLFLTEIMENLLSNALKFSHYGKTVYVSVSESTSTIKICVKDEGPGLTNEDHAKLFQKFQRLSAQATDSERSTGLGLSIVKKYTELMNGKVWCESEAGKGATFYVEFPKSTI